MYELEAERLQLIGEIINLHRIVHRADNGSYVPPTLLTTLPTQRLILLKESLENAYQKNIQARAKK